MQLVRVFVAGYLACHVAGGMLHGQPYEIEPVTAEWVPMAESYADGRTAPLGAVTAMAAGPNRVLNGISSRSSASTAMGATPRT